MNTTNSMKTLHPAHYSATLNKERRYKLISFKRLSRCKAYIAKSQTNIMCRHRSTEYNSNLMVT